MPNTENVRVEISEANINKLYEFSRKLEDFEKEEDEAIRSNLDFLSETNPAHFTRLKLDKDRRSKAALECLTSYRTGNGVIDSQDQVVFAMAYIYQYTLNRTREPHINMVAKRLLMGNLS